MSTTTVALNPYLIRVINKLYTSVLMWGKRLNDVFGKVKVAIINMSITY